MDSPKAIDDNQLNGRQHLSGTNGNNDSMGPIPMRTVYVVYSFTMDQIKDYFSQYGEIESIVVRITKTGRRYCFVQFKREEDAKATLLGKKDGWCWFEVKAADPWHQPGHPLQVPPEQDSESNILLALNDHCLLEIFKHLTLPDLTNAAGVCVKFNEQAKSIFASDHMHLNLSREFYYHQDLIETAMEYFGKDIQSLCISSRLFKTEADAIHSIARNCGSKLKQLKLCFFQFQTDLAVLRPIFAGIEKIKLGDCSGSLSLDQLMAGCAELKSLKLSNCKNIGQHGNLITKQKYPKLQVFSLRWNEIKDEAFKSFIIRHPTLIKLSIKHTRISCTLRLIGEHAKNLRELKFVGNHYGCDDQFQKDAAFIGQLNSLKQLRLYLDSRCPIVAVLNALVAGAVPIENMEIQFDCQPNDDAAIKCISQLKQIKKLRLDTEELTRRVTDKDMIELAKGLPELEELHLEEDHTCNHLRPNYMFKSELSTIGLRKMLMHSTNLKLLKIRWIDSIKIDVDDFKAMLRTVQNREEKVPLTIEIQSIEDQIDVPATVLAENPNIFNIKEIHIEACRPVNFRSK